MYNFSVQVQRPKPVFDARTIYLFGGELRCNCLMTTLYCVYCVYCMCVCDYCQSAIIDHLIWFMYFLPEQCHDIIYILHLTIINIIPQEQAWSWLWAWIITLFIINWLSFLLLRIHPHASRFGPGLVHVIGTCTLNHMYKGFTDCILA